MSKLPAPSLSRSLACALVAAVAGVPGIASAANYVEILTARVGIPDAGVPYLLNLTVNLEVAGVTGVVATAGDGTTFNLFPDGDAGWDTVAFLGTIEELRTLADGTWTIEVVGDNPSTSTFTYAAASYVDADLPPLATDIFPAQGQGCVDAGITFTWSDPTAGTADAVAVSVCDDFNCQDDDSVLGTMQSTDTSWAPPLPLGGGANELEVIYVDFDDADRMGQLLVSSGDIVWGNSPYAPGGLPLGTPLLLDASFAITEFTVSSSGRYVIHWIDRVDYGFDPGAAYTTGMEIDLTGVSGVTAVEVTTPIGTILSLENDGGSLWDTNDIAYPNLDAALAEANGIWTIEILGAQPSLSIYFLDASTLAPASFFAPATGLSPTQGASVSGDVTFEWTPPSGGAGADALAVDVFSDLGDVGASTFEGGLSITDTSWTPPSLLEPGDYQWAVYYTRIDTADRVTPFTVLEGTIDWQLPCFAPPGYPAGTPLFVYGGDAAVDFSVSSGGGGFVYDPPVEIGSITEAGGIGVADFDGINGNDIAVPVIGDPATDPGSVAVFLNDGTGLAYERVDTTVGVQPSAVTWGDFDAADGTDVAVTNAGDGTVTILLNDGLGEGTFITAQVIPVGALPSAIDRGDADGDLDLDLIVANAGDGTVVLLRNEEGTFVAEDPIPVGDSPSSVAFASFFGAPFPGAGLDFVVANEGEGTVVIFESDGAGGYAKAASVPVGGSPTSVNPEDIDHDKDTDMAVGGCDTGSITLIISDGAGGFETTEIPVGDCPSELAVEDMDGDGDADIVVVRESDSGTGERGVLILENLVEGGSLGFIPVGEVAVAEGLEYVFAAQLDGDGAPDLVTAESVKGLGAVSVITNSGAAAPGDVNGDGVVDVADLLEVLSAWGPCPDPPATCPADLDGDSAVGVGDLLEVLANWS